jgi:hypothetical protein
LRDLEGQANERHNDRHCSENSPFGHLSEGAAGLKQNLTRIHAGYLTNDNIVALFSRIDGAELSPNLSQKVSSRTRDSGAWSS